MQRKIAWIQRRSRCFQLLITWFHKFRIANVEFWISNFESWIPTSEILIPISISWIPNPAFQIPNPESKLNLDILINCLQKVKKIGIQLFGRFFSEFTWNTRLIILPIVVQFFGKKVRWKVWRACTVRRWRLRWGRRCRGYNPQRPVESCD